MKLERAQLRDELARLMSRKAVFDRRVDRLAADVEALDIEIAAAEIRASAHEIPAFSPVRIEIL